MRNKGGADHLNLAAEGARRDGLGVGPSERRTEMKDKIEAKTDIAPSDVSLVNGGSLYRILKATGVVRTNRWKRSAPDHFRDCDRLGAAAPDYSAV